MNRILKDFFRFEKEVRALRSLMPLGAALKLANSKQIDSEIRVYLKPIQREILIRMGTSDLECLKKIFLLKEYSLPFEISPKVIVDAGANSGMATLYFANQFPNANIIAIEPEPTNFKVLRENCAGLKNVTLIEAALWPFKQTVKITNPRDEKWSFIVSPSENHASSATDVPTISVTELLDKTPNGQIDWLKLDIEGAELELFSHNPENWLEQIKLVTIELHDNIREGCSRAFYSAILKHKFKQTTKGETVIIQFDQTKHWGSIRF